MCTTTKHALTALNAALDERPLVDGQYSAWVATLAEKRQEFPMVYPARDDVIIPQRAIQARVLHLHRCQAWPVAPDTSKSLHISCKRGLAATPHPCDTRQVELVQSPTSMTGDTQCNQALALLSRTPCRCADAVRTCRCCMRRQAAMHASPPGWGSIRCGRRSGTPTTCRADGQLPVRPCPTRPSLVRGSSVWFRLGLSVSSSRCGAGCTTPS